MRGFCKLVLLAAERQTTDGTKPPPMSMLMYVEEIRALALGMTWAMCLCVFVCVCVCTRRCLVCRPSHLCVCRVGTPPARKIDKIGRVIIFALLHPVQHADANERTPTRMPAQWMDGCMDGAPTHARTHSSSRQQPPGRGSKMNHLETRKGPDFSRHHQQRAFFEKP